MSENKIGSIEAIALVLTIVINHVILNLSKDIIHQTASASLLNILFVSLVIFAIIAFITRVFQKFPDFDLLDISHFLGGKWLRFILGFLFLAYFLCASSMLLRSFAESIQLIYFPRTPVAFILALFLIAAVFANQLGFKSIIKSNLIVMPVILLSILFIFFANTQNFTPQRIFPILGNGVNPTFFSGLSNLYAFSGIAYLYFIPPYLKKKEDYKKVAYTSIGISAFYLIISISTLLFIFPFVVATEEVMPLYIASRFIEFGRFFQRLDAIFLFIWILSMISYLSIVLSFCLSIFKKMANLRYSKPLIYLFALLSFSICLIPKNMAQINFFESTIYPYLVLGLVFGISLLILLLALWKKNRQKKGEDTYG